jgi:hypothetical protein
MWGTIRIGSKIKITLLDGLRPVAYALSNNARLQENKSRAEGSLLPEYNFNSLRIKPTKNPVAINNKIKTCHLKKTKMRNSAKPKKINQRKRYCC